jgi:hypothetical protein
MLRVEFDKKLFTNNEMKRWYNGPRNKGWAIYRSYKNQLEELIRYSVVEGVIRPGLGKPRVKRLVQVLYITKKLQDKDNFYASLKPLMDALVDLDCIKDDSPQWCKLVADQRSDYGSAYRVIIEIK